MTRPRLLVTALAALLLTLGLTATACGGGGDKKAGGSPTSSGGASSMAAYFSQLERMLETSRSDAATVEQDLNSALDKAKTVDDAIGALGTAVTDFRSVARDFHDGMQSMAPPNEVASLHEDFLSLYSEANAAFDQVLSDLDKITNEQDLVDLSGRIQQQFGDLTARTDSKCKDLQQIADDHDLSVDLKCGT